MGVLRRIKQYLFMYTLIPIFIMSMVCELHGGELLYLSKKFIHTIIELQEKNPQHPWSPNFCYLAEQLKGGLCQASEELVASVIDECLEVLDAMPQEGSQIIDDFLTFKKEFFEDFDTQSLRSDQDCDDGDCALDHCLKIDMHTPSGDGPRVRTKTV